VRTKIYIYIYVSNSLEIFNRRTPTPQVNVRAYVQSFSHCICG